MKLKRKNADWVEKSDMEIDLMCC